MLRYLASCQISGRLLLELLRLWLHLNRLRPVQIEKLMRHGRATLSGELFGGGPMRDWNEAFAHIESRDGLITLERLLYRVLYGFVPLFGVRKHAFHEVAGAPSPLGCIYA